LAHATMAAEEVEFFDVEVVLVEVEVEDSTAKISTAGEYTALGH
jgi:hypothetical protein